MSDKEISSVESDEVFLDTSVLYDYTKDETAEAISLFEDHQDIQKATSESGEGEYKEVAERRAEALERIEEFAANNPLTEFSFEKLDFLTNNDMGALEQYRDNLLQNNSKSEALRKLNKRKRAYKRGVGRLFGGENSLVIVRDLDHRHELNRRFQIDIKNPNDREILCHAADWHDKGFGNTFATSDRGDFADSRSELGNYMRTDGGGLPDTLADLSEPPLIERINESIQREYGSEAWLHIMSVDRFLSKAV